MSKVSPRLRALPFLLLAAAPLFAEVVVNEIHYAPADKTRREEFVELYNSGPDPVNLTGWKLAGGVDYAFAPETVIAAGEYLVVAQDSAALVARFGDGPYVGPFRGRLDNDGERLVLRDPDGWPRDEVDYGRGFPWPVVGGDAGLSIELVHPALDNDLGANWRPSDPGLDESRQLVAAGAIWRFARGTGEASSPRDAWRGPGFDDSAWEEGTASIGYGEPFVATVLADMRGGYSSVFLRREFDVSDPAAAGGLLLEVLYDDGFNAWINGVHVAGANVGSDDLPFDGTASRAIEDHDFHAFPLPDPGGYLVAGTNVLAIQLHNASIGNSSDAFIDARLSRSSGAGAGPTPGRRNSVWSPNAPPALRQASHLPHQPASDGMVLVSVKATDPDGVVGVTLEYQEVDPGHYLDLDDPEYAARWTSVPMNDAGQDGDSAPGDSTWSALLPAHLQRHRRLVRYRFVAEDSTGLVARAPFADDPQPNFAYFVYDGVPAWRGAIEPGSSDPVRRAVVEYPAEVMSRVPVYHLIADRATVEEATWRSKYKGADYLWRGTLVYDGDVYDYIHFRTRGGVWRYSMGKNMWKFDFLRGHPFRARDDFGHRYRTGWDKLNFSAIIQQGNFLHRGEQGLFESTGFRMFNLMGVEAPKTHYVQFRIIDEEDEAGASQYDGDLWGLYLVVEQMDGRFLDEHRLPDGNLYKMEGGSGTLNNLGATGVKDRSDLDEFLSTYQSTTPPDAWWRENLDLDRYTSFRSVVEGIHHYDIGYGKNYFYYLNPASGRWQVHPWDLDLTWADNMFGNGNEPFKSRVLTRAPFALEYRNRIREFRDLFYNTDQAYQLIDEYAAIVDDPAGGPSLVDVDRAMWDYNPVMIDASIVNLGKAGQGRFYQAAATKDFPGMVQKMKDYVVSRGAWIDSTLARDSAIPERPAVTPTGPAGFPLDGLSFRASSFRDPQGDGAFAAMRWRAGEVALPGAPPFDPLRRRPLEIEPVWESGDRDASGRDITIPAWALEVGHRYRVRARMEDDTGRWSHWSAPVELAVGEPAVEIPEWRYLRITEVMYNPPEGADLEFIELENVGPVRLDLTHVALRGGVEFDFAEGEVASLGPGEIVLVVKNRAAFSSVHDTSGVRIAGEYSGRLDNAGERIALLWGRGETILDFTYLDEWEPLSDGLGHSLVSVDPTGVPAAWSDPAGWRASDAAGGSPGYREGGGGPVGGRQRVGDANQDGQIDLSDAVSLLLHLFTSGAGPLPCDGTSVSEGGTALLLDANGDAAVDLSDAVHLLSWLFRGGAEPAGGTECRRIEGCPSVCGF